MDKITVCIMTKNSARTLRACLEPLMVFDELLVLDTGSTDATLNILSEYPRIRVLHQDGIGNFGRSRNVLADASTNDWILMIDSDEIMELRLAKTIRALPENPKIVYALYRVNHYRDRAIHGCIWYPEYCPRLYHRGMSRWKERIVHESLDIPRGVPLQRLRGAINHFSCEGASQLVRKGLWYAELYAQDFSGKRRTSLFEACFRASWTFFRSFLLRWGFWYGRDGFVISCTAAFGTWMKYILLQEQNDLLAARKAAENSNKEQEHETNET